MKQRAIYLATLVSLSVAATFIVRASWGASSPWWNFAVAGVFVGTFVSLIWGKAGWWD